MAGLMRSEGERRGTRDWALGNRGGISHQPSGIRVKPEAISRLPSGGGGCRVGWCGGCYNPVAREGVSSVGRNEAGAKRWRPFDVLNPIGRLTALRPHFSDALQRTPDLVYWLLFWMWMVGVLGTLGLWLVFADVSWTVGGVRLGLLRVGLPFAMFWTLLSISRATLASYIEAAELDAARRHFDVNLSQITDDRLRRISDRVNVQRFRLRCFEAEHRAMAGDGLIPFEELPEVQGSAWRPLNVFWAFGVPMPADYVASGLQRIPGYVYRRAVGVTILAWAFFGCLGVLILTTSKFGGSTTLNTSYVIIMSSTVTFLPAQKRFAKRLLAYARGAQVAVKG